MANTKSAAKRSRQTTKRSLRNRSVLSQLRNLKKRTPVTEPVDAAPVRALVYSTDKAAKHGIIHRNTPNRRTSSLARALRGARK